MRKVKLNEYGQEVFEGVSRARKVSLSRPPTLQEQIAFYLRLNEVSRQADSAGLESFEEADDFDVHDDFDPSSPYEENFDHNRNIDELARQVYSRPKEAPRKKVSKKEDPQPLVEGENVEEQ